MIVKGEFRIENRRAALHVDVSDRFVNGDVEGTAVFLIVGDFDILQCNRKREATLDLSRFSKGDQFSGKSFS